MRRDVSSYRPEFVAPGEVRDAVVVDELQAQLEQLARGRAAGESPRRTRSRRCWTAATRPRSAPGCTTRGATRSSTSCPQELHRELRLDRNRYAITEAEQATLGALTIAVAGLSVGRAVVTTLAHEGIGGELRLADFDTLDLSNLNRVGGGLADVGIGKVVLAAREVAELDPYIRVVAFGAGIDEANIGAFVDGADVLVDECDGLEMKLLLRERARAARLPVVMATSHRGMLDVERFDREPERPAFHGLLGDVTAAELGGLTTKQKVPYVVRILDPASLTDRAAASLVEVKESISTWPQLASDVALGGAMVTNAVRRIALGEPIASGRFYADLDALTPVAAPHAPAAATRSPARRAVPPWPATPRDELRFITACATTAPSGGNVQPWRFEARDRVLRAYADPTRSSLLDFHGRATLLALGAALEAAVIGARALGHEPAVAAGRRRRRVGADARRRAGRARRRRRARRCGSAAATAARTPRRRSRATRSPGSRPPARRCSSTSSTTRARSATRSARWTGCASSPRACARTCSASCASRARTRATASTSPRSSSTPPTAPRSTCSARARGWRSWPTRTAAGAC